ncbi:classical arabinogalactan protein 9-like isoform X2 [Amaranthus tricolor]|uniref:classical arabinogalactan protein 9-like isoform X2 n=1 Tax=Amaranthus tricolor TaxID=29722 RepID=UPI0025906AA0|nr:classical arabinogalactan protein 9-like isoform X2 [Amaranthus tricolor]
MKTNYVGMETVMMAGVLVLLMAVQFMPVSAQQQQGPAFCWDRIMTCRRGAMSTQQFNDVCCKVVAQIVSNETPCFCSIKPVVNETAVQGINVLLNSCNINAPFDTICSGNPRSTSQQTPSAPSPSMSAPSPPSPSTSASSPGPSSSPPDLTPPNPPPGEAPSLAQAPMMPPQGEGPITAQGPAITEAPQGSTESPTAFSPAPTPAGNANKIGSVAGASLLVLLAYVLF